MGSITGVLTSISPAVFLILGFLLIFFGAMGDRADMVQGGWGFVTVGVVVQFVLPVSRRLR